MASSSVDLHEALRPWFEAGVDCFLPFDPSDVSKGFVAHAGQEDCGCGEDIDALPEPEEGAVSAECPPPAAMQNSTSEPVDSLSGSCGRGPSVSSSAPSQPGAHPVAQDGVYRQETSAAEYEPETVKKSLKSPSVSRQTDVSQSAVSSVENVAAPSFSPERILASPAPLPAFWEAQFIRLCPPYTSVWTYPELAYDFGGKPDPLRRIFFGETIAALSRPKGTITFWPLAMPAEDGSLLYDPEAFWSGVARLGARYVVCFGEEPLSRIDPTQPPKLGVLRRHGVSIVCLPPLSQLTCLPQTAHMRQRSLTLLQKYLP